MRELWQNKSPYELQNLILTHKEIKKEDYSLPNAIIKVWFSLPDS